MYYYFNAHYYDERHDYQDQQPVKVKAESAEEAGEKAQAELRKFEAAYPYKVYQSIELEQEIPDYIVEGVNR